MSTPPPLACARSSARCSTHPRGRTAVSDELAGRIAVVTGAGSGLGAAMCRRFAAAGMAIAALDIDPDGAQAVAGSLAEEFGVATMSTRVDVGDAASLAAASAEVDATLGGC